VTRGGRAAPSGVLAVPSSPPTILLCIFWKTVACCNVYLGCGVAGMDTYNGTRFAAAAADTYSVCRHLPYRHTALLALPDAAAAAGRHRRRAGGKRDGGAARQLPAARTACRQHATQLRTLRYARYVVLCLTPTFSQRGAAPNGITRTFGVWRLSRIPLLVFFCTRLPHMERPSRRCAMHGLTQALPTVPGLLYCLAACHILTRVLLQVLTGCW